MCKRILILVLTGCLVFGIYAGIGAQELSQVNTPIRISATSGLDKANKLDMVKSPDTEIQSFDAPSLERREKNFSLTDLFSTFKKVFFGIISALGEIKESLF